MLNDFEKLHIITYKFTKLRIRISLGITLKIINFHILLIDNIGEQLHKLKILVNDFTREFACCLLFSVSHRVNSLSHYYAMMLS